MATGKPEAGIRSLGIGTTAARKLAGRYPTVCAILAAAERGELAGWGTNVQRVFSTAALAATAEQLRRNAAAVSICRDPSILEPALSAAMQAAVKTTCETGPQQLQAPGRPVGGPAADSDPVAVAATGGDGCERERARQLAWSYPDARLRWQHVQPHAKALDAQLAAAGVPHAVQHALPNGCTVDIAVFSSSNGNVTADVIAGAEPTAVLLRTACDLVPSRADAMPLQLKARLTGRALRHRKLLTRFGWAVLDVDCTEDVDMSSVVDSLLQ